MMQFKIQPVDSGIQEKLRHKIDFKTKPLGALGQLEKLALRLGSIQGSLTPVLRKPTIIVFAGDHGIVAEGVSAYPQEVTFQMVFNFLAGGAGINVFSRQNGIKVKTVDAGVNHDFERHPDLVHLKIAKGTHSFLKEPAMTEEQCRLAIERGASLVEATCQEGCNVIGFGEMGIGNTSSASVLMSVLCGLPIKECVGRGTGVDDAGLIRKINILTQAVVNQPVKPDPLTVLKTLGGFEIAMMVGSFLKAAELKMVILVDGFIATSALLVASRWHQHVLDYCVFSHVSDESGHRRLLDELKATPLLNLQMRLGEGTGAAVAYPLVLSAAKFLEEMASFESAGVSNKG